MQRCACLVLLSIVAHAPAHAESRPCAVTIVRAPDDAKATVERWLAKEPCATPLTVRIIETEGQLYIYAQDERGRVRERIVPDAESAGVLIASWTADDGIAIAEPAPIVARAAPIVVAPAPVRDTPHDLTAVFRPAPPPPPAHWLSLAAGAGSGVGLRAEVEALRRGSFSANVQLAWAASAMNDLDDPQSTGIYVAHFEDLSALVSIHYTWPFARSWHVRAGLGAGLVASQLALSYFDQHTGVTANADASLASAVAEASLLIGYTLTDHRQVELGPVGTVANQRWYMVNQMETLIRAPGSLLIFAGVRRAL